MLRNNPKRCPLSIRMYRLFLLAGIAAAIPSQAAFGHTVLLSQGQAVFEECRATLELNIAIEDFTHWYGFGPDSSGLMSTEILRDILERHTFALHRIFLIRDADGNPLASDPFRVRFDCPSQDRITWGDLRSLRARFATTFSYPCAPRFLTLQLLMGSDCPSILWQTILSVQGTAVGDSGRVLNLTSRGNAETIELLWHDKHASLVPKSEMERDCADDSISGLTQICADILVGREAVEVRIAIPLSLLQTWLVLGDNDDAFFDTDEQKAVRSEIERLLSDALSVKSEERNYAGEITEIMFLPLGAADTNRLVERRRVSMYTGRLIARLRFGPIAALTQADFRWNLFNNAVLSVTATIGSEAFAVRHEFSTYHPEYHWQIMNTKRFHTPCSHPLK